MVPEKEGDERRTRKVLLSFTTHQDTKSSGLHRAYQHNWLCHPSIYRQSHVLLRDLSDTWNTVG